MHSLQFVAQNTSQGTVHSLSISNSKLTDSSNSYQRRFEELREKVDEVICVSVNDAHVMAAWRQYLNDHCKDCFPSGKNIKYLADPSAKFTKQAGLDVDLTGANLGVRSKRYSMIVDNGEVVFLNVEDSPGQFQASTAEIVIEQLKQL